MIQRLITFLFVSLPLAALAQSEVYYQLPPVGQRMAGLTSSEVTLVQTGQLNQLHMQETGEGNGVHLTQQGNNNVLDIDLSGSHNRYSFTQQGDNNAVQWHSRQSNSQLETIQRGNNNQLIQEGSTPAIGVPMRIEQSGGMQLVITKLF